MQVLLLPLQRKVAQTNVAPAARPTLWCRSILMAAG